jgi:hypothetical protein
MLSNLCKITKSRNNNCLLFPNSHNSKILWDSCCTFTIINDRELLYDIELLPKPKILYGIGDISIMVTHKGRLKILPPYNNINVAYYSKAANENLLSLGHMQRCGIT